jgi:diketogulonate reductase-like aldo/keto reductase
LKQPDGRNYIQIEVELSMATAKIPMYKLNNGIEMPALGLGVFHADPEQTVIAVRSAIRNGYRLIDTAAFYMNERQVGEGMRASGVGREDIFVTTKVWISDFGYDRTLHAFDESLRKLGLDFIDMYMVHWPVPSHFETTVNAYKATMKLLEDGRVRAIGVCNFRPVDLDKLVEQTGHVPAVNQVELHPFFNQPEIRAANKKHGVITQAWSPIGGVNRYGIKAAKTGKINDPLSHPAIFLLANKYEKTPAQIVLRWQIQLGTSPIPKSVRPERIAENIDIFDFTLAPEEVQSISALDIGERGGPDPELVDPQNLSITNRD